MPSLIKREEICGRNKRSLPQVGGVRGGGELLGVSKPSPKPLNLSPTTTYDPQFDKAEFARKTKKLQIPFVANNGQVDERVRFYAKTFGGTVFVTKDGEIVYAMPHTATDASPLAHDEINKDKTGYTGLTGFPGKKGRCIVHRALCAMYPYCTWNFPVYYSESNFPVCHSERSEESYLNNSQPEILNPTNCLWP